MRKQVAKLVYFTLLARVVVDEDASDEQIVAMAKPRILASINNDELGENVEKIIEDLECPANSGGTDRVITE